MAVLFLLALALIGWQASRIEQAGEPAFEVVTKAGERLSPVAVPSWRLPIQPPRQVSERLTFLQGQTLSWPGNVEPVGEVSCMVFVRISSQHWALRKASAARVRHWLGCRAGEALRPWQLLHLPAASFLDDDDRDGDPLDSGELRETGSGAETEVFCEAAAGTPEDLP